MSVTDPTKLAAAIDAAPAGRSLWADAWSRLLRNRPAVVSAVILSMIALACIIGPILSPHGYADQYNSYNKEPPSLSSHPDESLLPELLERPLRRARADIADVGLEGNTVTLTLQADDPIDPRIVQAFERTDDFSNATIIDTEDEGRTTVIRMEMDRNTFLLGTDANGRDLLTRILHGGRVSLMIGILATAVSLLIGVTYGAVAGFVGGQVDHIMMRIVDILYSIPFMFFVILLMVFFGRNWVLMFIAVGAVEWLDMARIVRGQTLSLKRKEFIEAAHAIGVKQSTIVSRHVVPNVLGPVVVYMTLMVPKVILLESFLSFLGLGVQEPMTSWGVLIALGANNIVGATYLLVCPAVFLAVTLFCLNFIGDGLRDALDPKDR